MSELKSISIPKNITTHRSPITFHKYHKLELDGRMWNKQPQGEPVLPDRTLQSLDALLKRESGMRYDAFGRNGTNCQMRTDAWRKYLTGKEPQERLLTQLMREVLRWVPQEPGQSESLLEFSGASSIVAGKASQLACVPLGLVADSSPAGTAYDPATFIGLTFPFVSIESPPPTLTYVGPAFLGGSAGSQHSCLLGSPRSSISKVIEIESSDNSATHVGGAEERAPSFEIPESTPTSEVPHTHVRFSSHPEGSRRPVYSSSNSEQARTAQRLEESARVHGPGLLGAAKNTYDCFADGDIFMGVWNTFALTWSTGVLCATGGYGTLVVEARKDADGEYKPHFTISIGGLINTN